MTFVFAFDEIVISMAFLLGELGQNNLENPHLITRFVFSSLLFFGCVVVHFIVDQGIFQSRYEARHAKIAYWYSIFRLYVDY